MRGPVVAALTLAVVAGMVLPAAIPPGEYQQRRANLREKLKGTLVLFGKGEPADVDVNRFRQETNFYYLTGWTEPNARLLITHDREILFLPHHDERREVYTGKRASAEDPGVNEKTGFQTVMPLEKFERQLRDALDSGPELYADETSQEVERLKPLFLLRKVRAAGPLIGELRRVKSAAEIEMLQHSADVSMEAQRAAWKKMKAGAYEYQAQAAFTETMMDQGCEGYAYPPIIGSGPNSTVLHYETNRRRMDRGEVVVIDAAAECQAYAADITRTIPVSGRFTARQREIYNIVLGAQKAAIAAIKPGAAFYGPKSVSQIAIDYINSHGKDKHGEPLGKYYTHGLGHPVGLDVHDEGSLAPTLKEGMVLTVEPGIYIPEESIGVRIEDMVLVTKDGARIMTGALPKDPDDVERALAE
ncbi:MAG TPA: Xaa-Pro peptidase family protein [Bryobacteraceae bacterium]|nr:Xaa-Pro peptidase family protein [Bryobacteraceae bacterium]